MLYLEFTRNPILKLAHTFSIVRQPALIQNTIESIKEPITVTDIRSPNMKTFGK